MEQIVRDHLAHQQAGVRLAKDRAKHEASAAVTNLSDVLVESVNLPVAIAFRNQQHIESLEKSVLAEVKTFTTQTKKWLDLVETLNTSLKELGDVNNWANAIEADVSVVVDVLQSIPPPNASPSSSASGSLSRAKSMFTL
ncbi:biogenesis of lysosome- organelles complex 1 subunit 1 [Podochytrium sp. JEL0797]|nr:biogenesis of lysosome- organelles complex 1 subunit 1 [Podochytrium sp. JEL0797]